MNIGDTVRLKSGGPVMTVSNPKSSNGLTECHWFNQTGAEFTQKWAEFKAEMLKPVT